MVFGQKKIVGFLQSRFLAGYRNPTYGMLLIDNNLSNLLPKQYNESKK